MKSKKHKQRFEHVHCAISDYEIKQTLFEFQEQGYELVTALQYVGDEKALIDLFFKRPV